MTLPIDHYPDSLRKLGEQLERTEHEGYADTHATSLARTLIDGAIKLDLERARNLGLVASYKEHGVVRDADHPQEFEHPDGRSGIGADNPAHPLPDGEHWNEGRRATQTGAIYGTDDKGRPVNPYMNTGLNGRGMMWLFGPNHCIDNGVLEIADDEHGQPVLNMIGIVRKDDALKRPALSGGFAKFTKTADGSYVFDEEGVLETRLEEFFEEMISDSVPLLPAYAARVEDEFAQAVRSAGSRSGGELSAARTHELRDQTIVALKLEQVRALDAGFLDRLKEFLAQGHECFAGPVLSSGRATNNAWIESRMSWVILDEPTWKHIAGNGPFDYKLSGGDDSDGVFHFPVTPEIIKSALPSHGPMMTYMLASFVLDAQERGVKLHPNIMRQIEDIADFYSPPLAALPPPFPALP